MNSENKMPVIGVCLPDNAYGIGFTPKRYVNGGAET